MICSRLKTSVGRVRNALRIPNSMAVSRSGVPANSARCCSGSTDSLPCDSAAMDPFVSCPRETMRRRMTFTLATSSRGLEAPAPQAPGAPGSRRFHLLFYKATTAGNKGGIEPAKGNGPVDGRQCLWSEGKQIVHVDPHALAGGFAAVVDIVVGDDGGEIDQRADVERCRQGDEVGADQPGIRAVQNDAGDDEHEPECDQHHPDESRDAPPGQQIDLNIEVEAQDR